MPVITLEISEQQEAEIRDLIDGRKSFRIDGGSVIDSAGNTVRLREIVFNFAGFTVVGVHYAPEPDHERPPGDERP